LQIDNWLFLFAFSLRVIDVIDVIGIFGKIGVHVGSSGLRSCADIARIVDLLVRLRRDRVGQPRNICPELRLPGPPQRRAQAMEPQQQHDPGHCRRVGQDHA
jgi:hypothetical protein